MWNRLTSVQSPSFQPEDRPAVLLARRRAYAVALSASLPGMLLILHLLVTAGLYFNAVLHGLVTMLMLAGLLLVWRWPTWIPLGERLMAIALTASATAYGVAHVQSGGALLFPGFASSVLLFIGIGLLVVLPTRVAGGVSAVLFVLNVVGDWWPTPSQPPGVLLVEEGMLAGSLALALILALYRSWLNAAQQERSTYEQLAHTDHLTELPNRRAVLAAWRSLSARQATALLIFDLDDFKRINDRYGHHEGDRVLWHVGQVLMGALGERGTLGRWGGEEFLAVLPVPSLGAAHGIAEELRLAVHQAGGDPEALSVSVGLTLCAPGDAFGPALRRADTAMYRAKRDGKNVVRVEEA